MSPRFLLPETVARHDGVGAEFSLDRRTPVLLTLNIHRIIEHESLEVSIWGSPDSRNWRQMASFPHKSYCGSYSMELDLSCHAEVRYLRAQWKMGRWASSQRPLFGFDIHMSELKLRHAGAA